MSGHSIGQEEHQQISTALEVEHLEVNLFRSIRLWKPPRSRGVFGGQVISQACVSATNCVDPEYSLHSLHCYFLASASPAIPIIYQVERLRQGKSYTTVSVKAIQNGSAVFMMLCSFHIPEPWHPSHQWPMPNVIPAGQCDLIEDMYFKLAARDGLDERLKKLYLSFAEERKRSPIAVKTTREQNSTEGARGQKEEGTERDLYFYWMKAKNIPKHPASYQKCILGYISDLYFIGSAARVVGLKSGGKGRNGIGMTSTIDHSICFYDNEFDCGDWLLYAMTAPRVGSGRGYVRGRLYTESGTLVAVTTQEGVIRSAVRGPEEVVSSENSQAKL